MDEPDLDAYCKKIVTVLTLLYREYRFNALLRFLNKHGTKISKPTLSDHLKHLTERKIVLRKQIGIQKVTYAINAERFQTLGAVSESTKEIVAKHFQEEEKWRSLPIGRKIDYFHTLTVLQSLMLLKLEILAISKPKDQFELSLSQYVTIEHFGTIQSWLLDEIRKNPKELEQALKELQDLADECLKVIFTPESIQESAKRKRQGEKMLADATKPAKSS